MIRYPNIIGKTDAQKLDQMKSYLHQLVDELNFQLEKNSNNSNDTVQATTKSNSTASTKSDDAISSFNEIKGLIIKSADIVNAYSEEISKKLEGQYVAKSDFGTYKEKTQAQITANSKDIDIILEKQESIDEEVMETVRSEFEQQAERISLSVENGEATAQIVLKVGDRTIPATIDMKGLVTFSNLNDGTTEISGDNIKTGTILAEFIDVTNLIVSKLYALDDNGSGITLDVLGLKRTSADKLNPLIKLHHDWIQTGGFLEEKPYLDLFKTEFDRDVNPGELTGGITDGVHLDADGIEFRANIGNFSDYPVHSYDHIVDFGISRYGDVTGKLKVDTPTADSHVVNKQYADTNFAPAGFGLGSVNPQVISDLNTCKANGWYYTNESTLNVSHTYFKYASVHVSARTSTQIIQRLVSIGYPTKFEMLRYTDDGGATWIEEWVNPPMIAGAEYRTTERYMGKPVYAKLIDCQGMPSGANAAKAVQHNSANVESIVSFGGNMSVGGTKAIALPYYYSDTNLARIAVDYQQVRIFNGGTDLRGYTDAKVWFKYTKTTN